MSVVEVRDHALWIKHIHGNDKLKAELDSLKSGSLVELVVDDFVGTWVKMSDGKDCRPTPGIKPIGKSRADWHGLQSSRGDIVSIRKR